MNASDDDGVVESVELVILAISEDAGLLQWFRSLGELPDNLRENAILQITSAMAESGEDPDLVRAIAKLQRQEFHEIVARTIAELSS